jgi:hypothetical protein
MASKYVALKDISFQGKTFKKGESVDVSNLPTHKISQFLDQRMIKPA